MVGTYFLVINNWLRFFPTSLLPSFQAEDRSKWLNVSRQIIDNTHVDQSSIGIVLVLYLAAVGAVVKVLSFFALHLTVEKETLLVVKLAHAVPLILLFSTFLSCLRRKKPWFSHIPTLIALLLLAGANLILAEYGSLSLQVLIVFLGLYLLSDDSKDHSTGLIKLQKMVIIVGSLFSLWLPTGLVSPFLAITITVSLLVFRHQFPESSFRQTWFTKFSQWMTFLNYS